VALSLYPGGTGVLTTEFKVNLLNPAKGEQLVERGRVVEPGRTLTVCRADVYGIEDGGETHVAIAVMSMICLESLQDRKENRRAAIATCRGAVSPWQYDQEQRSLRTRRRGKSQGRVAVAGAIGVTQ